MSYFDFESEIEHDPYYEAEFKFIERLLTEVQDNEFSEILDVFSYYQKKINIFVKTELSPESIQHLILVEFWKKIQSLLSDYSVHKDARTGEILELAEEDILNDYNILVLYLLLKMKVYDYNQMLNV